MCAGFAYFGLESAIKVCEDILRFLGKRGSESSIYRNSMDIINH